MKALFLLLFPVWLGAQTPVRDRLVPADSVVLTGFAGQRLEASYLNRILVQDVDRLVEPFRNRTETRCWQSEFWGKWFTSAVLAYRYKPDPALRALLNKAVTELISTQTKEGYIGNYAPKSHLDQWDIWGRKYCLLGLLSWYDLTEDRRALDAALHLTDHLLKELDNQLIVRKGNHRGMAATSILEPLSLLYGRTGDPRYLAYAREIVRQWETADGPQLIAKAGTDVAHRFEKPKNWFGWEQGQKAYEMMSCYEGLLELYRLTGDQTYREAVEKTWENIRDTEINVAGSGSAMECWFGGKKYQTVAVHHYQETCVTVTWIKLSLQLLRLTGQMKYADAVEQSWFNALLGSMRPDGADWAKYTPLAGQRLEGSEQCGMGLNCCTASGPRGLFAFPFAAVMEASDGAQVNFYTAGAFRIKTPGGQYLTLTQDTDYPVSGKVRFRLALSRPEEFTLTFRIPEWCRQMTVNGQAVSGPKTAIRQEWKNGAVVELNLTMEGRVLRMGKEPEMVALVRGPIVLSRDARFEGPEMEALLTPAGKEETIALDPVREPGVWMAFRANFLPESYREGGAKAVPVVFCDYASAGNNPEHSLFRVWLPQLLDPSRLP